MAKPKVDEELKYFTVCGTVRMKTLLRVRAYAAQEGITVARAVGNILEEWRLAGGIGDSPDSTEEIVIE